MKIRIVSEKYLREQTKNKKLVKWEKIRINNRNYWRIKES